MAGLSLVIVGGGPRGSGLLDRIVANVPPLLGDRAVTVHVVEPFTLGAGRIWRHDQSPLLWANSQAEDMTMFTDASCTIEGPTAAGSTFLEWSQLPRPAGFDAPELESERADVEGMTFPSRRLLSEYLAWSFWRTVRRAPDNLTVRVHTDRVVDLTQDGDGRQLVHLERSAWPLRADAVLLAQGHLPSVPLGPSAMLVRAADEHGLTYLAEEYTADSDLSVLLPGQDVLVRGAGLSFVDLAVLVTQGRGGRFEEEPDGSLRYLSSGQEPRLFVGSRRGVPYRAKLGYRLQGKPAPHPRFLDPAAVDAVLAGPGSGPGGQVDFRADVWPLLAKELAFGHYHELFTAHAERVRTSWDDFEEQLARLPWGDTELAAVVAAAVPDPADRFDPQSLDRPLRGLQLADADALQDHLVAHIRADLARRADPRHSADLGAFNALLAVFEPLGRVLGSGRLSPQSVARDVAWFVGFFSYVASGPPPRRLQELIALIRAGVVRFLGAEVDVAVAPADGAAGAAFVATSPTVPGEVRATALVEARVPRTTVTGTADPLLAALHARGEVSEHVLADPTGAVQIPTGKLQVTTDTGQLMDAAGRAHPRRLAFGWGTSAATAGAFSRPGTNAAFFRQNDHAVRALLRELAAIPDPATSSAAPRPAAPTLDVDRLSADHPDAEPLLRELERDYSARYAGGIHQVRSQAAEDFTAPDGTWIVLRDAGLPVAAGAYRRFDDQTAEFKRIWTHPDRRGLGLSQRLVTELERGAADQGYRRVFLTTGPRQPEAERLYRSLGYTPLYDPAADPESLGPLPFEKPLTDRRLP